MTINDFYLDYNVTGPERKRLVQAIATYTQADAKYLGAPTFSYEVDFFTIDRNGVVSFDDRADTDLIEELIEFLAERGFEAQNSASDSDGEEVPAEETGGAPAPDKAAQEGNTLTIQMPAASFPRRRWSTSPASSPQKGGSSAKPWAWRPSRWRLALTQFPSPGSVARPPPRRSKPTRT